MNDYRFTITVLPSMARTWFPDMTGPGLLAVELEEDGPDVEWAERWVRIGGIAA